MSRFTGKGVISGAVVVLFFLVMLVGCGGGDSTSGAGGGGSVNASTGSSSSSSIVIDLSGGLAMLQRESSSMSDASQLATLVLGFLLESAWAQTAGVEVFIDGLLAGTTDADGNLAVAVDPGIHSVCFIDPAVPANCIPEVDVGPDQVVVITGVDIDEDEVLTYSISVESAYDNIVLFEDPDKAFKTLVCHKGENTISVGTQAALNGHMVHGDSPGECPTVAAGDGGSNPQPQPSGSGGDQGDSTTNEAPGNSGNAPGNSGNAPGNSGNAPGNSGNQGNA